MNPPPRHLFFGAAIALLLALLLATLAEAAPDHGDNQVTVFSDNTVALNDSVSGNAVAVFGSLKVDGEVSGDAVAVMGSNTINGTVHGQAVAVMGDLTLGPTAEVDGDVVCVAGTLHRAPGARVAGQIVHNGLGSHLHGFPSLRMVCLDQFHSRWAWAANLLILSLYALVALVFPGGIRKCGDTLAQRPGLSILSAVLTLLVLPVLFILLIVTIVGIPIALLVLPVGVVGLMMFGKASFYGLVGRAISRGSLPPPAAVFVGGLICLLFFVIPIAGFILSLLISLLMLGCGIVALFEAAKKPVPPAPIPASPPPRTEAPPAHVTPLEAAAASVAASAVPPPLAPPPPIQAAVPEALDGAALRRAGLGIRTLALVIDLVLVAGVFHGFGPFVLILLGAYGAIMWKFKGTTVGGIICGLKVVRLDGRPIDWPTAIARAAGCFLSMLAIGLGFIWVAFDDQRQSWHDKIAGTTVVHAPKGASLV